MGWAITLAVLVLLAVLPLGVKFRYDADGVALKVCVGFVTVWKMPSDKPKKAQNNQKEEKKEKKEKKQASQKAKPEQKKEKSGGSLTDFLPLVQVALDLLNDFRWKLRIKRLNVKLVLAGDDPCDLAVNYGRIWAAIGNLIPVLERNLVMKKRNIDIGCDFAAEQTLVTADTVVSITLGRLLYVVVKHGVRGLREFLNILKSRKGGAVS